MILCGRDSQAGEFPWGFDLSGTPRTLESGDTTVAAMEAASLMDGPLLN